MKYIFSITAFIDMETVASTPVLVQGKPVVNTAVKELQAADPCD